MAELTRVQTLINSPIRDVSFDFGLDLDLKYDAYLHEHYKRGICYESEIVTVLLRALKEGDTAIDVGANNGFFTVLMAKLVGDAGSVLAVEPIARNMEALQENLKLNQIENAELVQMPAGAVNKEVTFWESSDDTSSSCLWDPGLWPDNEQSRQAPKPFRTKTVSLDSLLPLDVTPTVIKIDTEGAEHDVLRGAQRLLRQEVPYVLAEMNPFGLQQMGSSDESLRNFMRNCGYDMFTLHNTGAIPSLIPSTTRLAYHNGVVVKNVLFSTIEHVAKAWPETLE